MKVIQLILIAGLSSFSLIAQTRPLTTEIIQEHSKTFTINNGTITGEGIEMVTSMISNAQFVTLGESHGSNQISVLTKAMLPVLADSGFKHFAIEVGPHSAKKLTELSSPSSSTVSNLKAFNATYSVARGDDTAVPIPFFDGVSDAEFLQVAREQGMDLWGLDQEFYFSAMFLTDELANTTKGTNQYSTIVTLKETAQKAMFGYFISEVKKEIDGAYKYIKEDPAVIAYLNAFDKSNTKAQEMIQDMKISWDIYIDWRNGSHDDRVSYICNNFYKNYKEALKTETTPKVFTKIGSLHAREIISNGAYDIGVFTQELANKNNTTSTSIICWRPYQLDEDGNTINNMERYSGYKRFKAFLPLARENEFTIINLSALKKDYIDGKIALPLNGDYHELRRLLESYDYLIMLPTDTEPVPNR